MPRLLIWEMESEIVLTVEPENVRGGGFMWRVTVSSFGTC